MAVVPQTTALFCEALLPDGVTRGMYRCIAITPEGFIQQLAVCYVGRGYWFYVIGTVPENKDPAVIDQKLIARYRVDLSKWARARRKRAGLSNVQYLRHGRFFVLLATHGQHELFISESTVLRDARRSPIRFAGYSVSYRGGHPHVRIDRDAYLELRAWLLDRAIREDVATLGRRLRFARFEPYAPVRRQLLSIWRAVNRARNAAGLEPLPVECIRMRRRIFKPFGDEARPACQASGDRHPGDERSVVADEEHVECERSGRRAEDAEVDAGWDRIDEADGGDEERAHGEQSDGPEVDCED